MAKSGFEIELRGKDEHETEEWREIFNTEI